MWLQFFSQNAHFAISLFAALVCFAVCWLYLDAWSNRRDLKELLRWSGFGLIGLSFLVQATLIEQTVLGQSVFGSITLAIIVGLRLVGYLVLIIGQVIEPLQAVPKTMGLELEPEKPQETKPDSPEGSSSSIQPEATTDKKSVAPAVLSGVSIGSWALPLGAFAIAVLYWRRATTGLERHLKPIAIAFLLISLSEAAGLARLWRGTQNPILYNWVAAFGVFWWAEHILLLIGAVMLGRWVWSYLTERFFSQLFMIFITITVVVFLVVSVGFTSLLLRNIRGTSLTNLETAGNVLHYALEAKQAEANAGAQQLAANNDLKQAIASKDRNKIIALTKDYLVDNKQSGLFIVNQNGQVLVRAEDTEQWGESLSDDPLVKRALLGVSQSGVSAYEGVTAPTIQVRSAAVVRDDKDAIIGAVVAHLELDSAFVDGVEDATGLQSSVFANKKLTATTIVGPDGKTRSLGVNVSNNAVEQTVLEKGESYKGSLKVQNRQMLAVFLPLKDVDNEPIGMLMVAQPENAVLRAAGRSVELTFLLTAGLLLLSVWPIFLVTRALVKQLD